MREAIADALSFLEDFPMRERPIIFSALMVRAILEGRKTVTRRVLKFNAAGRAAYFGKQWHRDDPDITKGCPYGQSGDRLWVREAWSTHAGFDDISPAQLTTRSLHYLADGYVKTGKGRPSIHMPRWASRITLEVTGVRVERLDAISAVDAEAEGLRRFPFEDSFAWALRDGDTSGYATPTGAFRNLWESINGAGSWNANPWVWVVEFMRVVS
jgi:hypothetical protein